VLTYLVRIQQNTLKSQTLIYSTEPKKDCIYLAIYTSYFLQVSPAFVLLLQYYVIKHLTSTKVTEIFKFTDICERY